MKVNKGVIIAIVVVVALGGLAAYKLIQNKEVVESRVVANDPGKEYLVEAQTVVTGPFTEAIDAIGTFEPQREVSVLSQANGEVKTLHFELGEKVKAGQVLVTVDKDILQAQYNAAVANYENAKSNLDRYENAGNNGIPQIQIDQSRLAVESAKSQMDVLAKQLKNTTVTAPFSGVITEKKVELGSTLGAGSPIATITDISTLKLTVNIPEKDIMHFKEGEELQVYCSLYPNQVFNGSIVMVGSKADKAHNYPLQVEVENKAETPLKAGMYGSIDNSVGDTALLVPKKALVGTEKDAQVYVIKDGVAHLHKIQIVSANNSYYAVSSGVKDGDVVVTSGHINLDDATPVKIAE